VNHVLTGGGRIPWEKNQLKDMIDRLKANGLSLGNLMIAGFPNTLYGRPGRDEEIEKVIQSIRAAGKVGLPWWNTTSMRIASSKVTTKKRQGWRRKHSL